MSLIDVLRSLRIRIRKIKISLSGRPESDLSFKQQIILEVGHKASCDVLIETGTLFGDTVNVARNYFDSVVSIEISRDFYEGCKQRFRKNNNVFLHYGDSSKILKEILKSIKYERAVFWLDAHCAGVGTMQGTTRCPILGELDALVSHSREDNCILIDDADCFGLDDHYPSIDEVFSILKNINANYNISIKNNIIMAIPSHIDI